jgi:O-methyltransferase involved in polyketide biosynthesis
MSAKNISRTAVGTLYLRAAHLLIDAQPWILEDTIALELIGFFPCCFCFDRQA